MIKLEAIHKYYGSGAQRLHVLKGIDLDIEPGEMVAIMGSSGSGKSTLLNIIGLLDGFDSGRYQLDGRPIARLRETEAAMLRNRCIGFVFQAFNLLPFKSALENVALPLFYQKVSRRQRLTRAQEYLELVGLGDRGASLPNELSGGQKQRVAIARALVTRPRVLLADEPTGALDSVTTGEIMGLFGEVHARGNTIVIVTHEADVAARCQRRIVIQDGRVRSTDVPAALAEPD